MRTILWQLMLSLAFVLTTGQAHAQDSIREPGFAPQTAPAQPPTSCEGVADADACWDLALGLLQRRQWAAATSVMRSFARAWPDDDRSSRALAVADALESSGRSGRETALVQQSGRVELIVFSTLYGAGIGAVLGSFDENDGSTAAIVSAVGGLVGLTTSILVTKDQPVNASQAALVTAGAVWGFGLGALGSISVDTYRDASDECADDEYCDYDTYRQPRWREWGLGLSIAGLTGTAILARRYPNLPRGDIALVNASGLWGTVFAGEFTALLLGDDNINEYSIQRGSLAGTILGLGGGVLLANRLDMSANRVRLANLGGFLGAGIGAAIISQMDYPDASSIFGIQIVAQTVGITSALLLTRERANNRRHAELNVPSARPRLAWNVAPTSLNDGQRQQMGMMFSGSF